MIRRLALRSAFAAVLACLALPLGLEGVARWLALDWRQGHAMAVQEGMVQTARRTGLAFPPRILELTPDGFTTRFGPCVTRFQGQSLVVLGDSVTVMTASQAERSGEFQGSWPLLLAGRLGPGWQVCVLAEIGWHPKDALATLERLRALLPPHHLVVQLCSNDATAHRDTRIFRWSNQDYLVLRPNVLRGWPGYYNRWLWERSEAFRYWSWRRATATGEAFEVRVELADDGSFSAHRALRDAGAIFFFTPPLDEVDSRGPTLAWAVAPAPVITVPVGPDDRRTPEDTVHLGPSGHQAFADTVYEALVARGLVSGGAPP